MLRKESISVPESKYPSIKPFINNDEWMVAEGLRLPARQPRDPNVWTKTLEEKAKARVIRSIKVHFGRWDAPERVIPIPGKLIIQVSGFEKTTFSHKCLQSDIPYIVAKYKSKGNVLKYYWNGKTYHPDVLPFWR